MKIVPRDEFITLLHSRGSKKLRDHLPRYDVDMILGKGECAVHEGTLTQSESWRPGTRNLLVIGALNCSGLVDIAPQGNRDWGGSLWTLGDLRCQNFAGHYGAAVIVDGDFIVNGLAVQAFEDSMLLVTGDFTAHFFYGQDIWAEVGGNSIMDYGDGYALPLDYDNAEAQAVYPRHQRKASLALLNLGDEEGAEELAGKLRRGEHFR